MSLSVSITAVPGIPDIQNGDDLAKVLGDCMEQAGLFPQDGDILCIAQKVFSKAEGCIIPLSTVTPSDEAIKYGEELNKDPRKVEIVLRESTRVVRSFRRPDQESGTMICEHRLGFISANAAVDESNFGEEDAAMVLPADPDASCARIQQAFAERFGVQTGVVMTDTFGRPWRLGQINVAIGLSKVPATIQEQGNLDAWGRPLMVTEPALADEISAASGLVVRKNGKTPAVLLRGLDWQPADSRGADIIRKKQEDMFR
ncbi:coenzyme F420-0:L-glutamate ligase [Leisingera methylohalidivorans]|uniref:F420-0:gamma-glutamyl ligase n=1 Tax=Leisingera methylohalidivorans DSM 14336 TaxID=999552 RepID=V9VT55_9RHOB|nr:coenzyme F420-0:L-glutamate ligase [Leisingera methylohalidivorans]AHD00057.1 F420-0:gamma-glutamyl ligase [Leisingera methylohalidivorans DSM 14336]